MLRVLLERTCIDLKVVTTVTGVLISINYNKKAAYYNSKPLFYPKKILHIKVKIIQSRTNPQISYPTRCIG